ncbi:MAG: outer membrane protein assembly factor BamA [Rhodospirillaceae bacterium]|nr:outer membrane protein assembly factor BamA [Rhodospirillaceae bacterium]
MSIHGSAFAQGVPTIVAPAPRVGAPSVSPRTAPTQPRRAGQPIVAEISVEGAQRIEPETVRSYMVIKEGDPFDSSRVNQSLKALYATGLFADVTLSREGDALVVRVVENPIINRIAFEGNARLELALLQNEVQLRPRIVYTRTRVQSDVKRLLELYRRTGRFAATVEPKVVQLPQNRVDLIFEIDEGALTGIRGISFIGNRAFSDRALREIIQTTQTRWYMFLTSNDTYDPDRLTFDRELLRRHYLKNGYADFRVASAVAELSPDRKDFFITFTIEEGKRYKFGKFNVASKIKEIDAKDLKEALEIESGEWYDAEGVDRAVIALSNAVSDKGFAFVDVRPQVKRDRKNNTININFEIREGARVYVERIDIDGNVRTLDKVIRREFKLVEGDAFRSTKLRRSRTRIQNLNYFSRVEINNIPGSTPDKTIIKVDVAEKSTGELSVGAGFSSSAGALADIKLRERNLLGRGLDFRISLTLATERQSFDVGITEPYFMGKELAAGIDGFHTQSNILSEFQNIATGGKLRLGYDLSEYLRHTVRYTIREDDISDVDSGASEFIKTEVGKTISSIIGHDLTYDRRNSKVSPTDGYLLLLSNDLAGLGGDVNYFKTRAKAQYHYSIWEGWVASVEGEIQNIFGFGDDVRVSDRFFLGGDKLHGFEAGGVGPRDLSTDDALGGKQSYSATAELKFPLGLPKQFGVTGVVFTDVGTLTGLDFESPNIVDTGSIRWSAGVGLGWNSPFGPIRIDFSQAIVKEDFDVTETVRFNFGTRF